MPSRRRLEGRPLAPGRARSQLPPVSRAIAKLLVLLPFFGDLARADAPRPEVRPPGCALGVAAGVSPFDEEEPEEPLAPEGEAPAPPEQGGDLEPDQSSSPTDGSDAEEAEVMQA